MNKAYPYSIKDSSGKASSIDGSQRTNGKRANRTRRKGMPPWFDYLAFLIIDVSLKMIPYLRHIESSHNTQVFVYFTIHQKML